MTQRMEFSRGFTGPLRPGVLVTVPHPGQVYPIWNGPGSADPPSDIDHVVAASRVNLATLPAGQTVEVKG